MTVYVVHDRRRDHACGEVMGVFHSWDKASAKAREHSGVISEWDPALGKSVAVYAGPNLDKLEVDA